MIDTIYDPPTGWRYGFPRKYKPLDGESLADTLIRDGYPREDAEWAAEYCRFWKSNQDKDSASSAKDSLRDQD